MAKSLKLLVMIVPAVFAGLYLASRDPLADLLYVSLQNDDSTFSRSIRSHLVQKPLDDSVVRLDYSSSSKNPNQRLDYSVLRSFRECVGTNWMSTVRVLVDGNQVAMGTVVDARGLIVTKASELEKGVLECRLFDQSRESATILERRDDVDLALLQVQRDDLVPAIWGEDSSAGVGSWLTSTDLRQLPLAVGVVSVVARPIRQERPVLGIRFDTDNRVEFVLPGSGADRANIQVGDVVKKINDRDLPTKDALLTEIGRLSAGEFVELTISRDETEKLITARLMDLNQTLLDPTEMEVNGGVSSRSTGFSSVFQHDTYLEPHQCGGPLVDLRGNVVGLNIARAGRVASYALPASVVRATVADMMTTASNGVFASAPTSDSSRPQVIDTAKPVIELESNNESPRSR